MTEDIMDQNFLVVYCNNSGINVLRFLNKDEFSEEVELNKISFFKNKEVYFSPLTFQILIPVSASKDKFDFNIVNSFMTGHLQSVDSTEDYFKSQGDGKDLYKVLSDRLTNNLMYELEVYRQNELYVN